MRYYLNVPFQQKDQAKVYGARWDPDKRLWYCTELNSGLMQWYEGDEKPPEQEQTEYRDSEGNSYKTVSDVNASITHEINDNDVLAQIFVVGEVTDYSGHVSKGSCYFTLMDSTAKLSCIMPERVIPEGLEFDNGKKLLVRGSFKYYSPNGSAKLNVIRIEDAGQGEDAKKLLELKAKLEAEGLFATERKKEIPKHPKTIGIVTSRNGQAIQDIRKVATKRNPYIRLLLYDVNVQGANAAPSTVEGIRRLDKMGCDILIVGRGGGSLEDLKAYNDEMVVRAVAAAVTPVISAVGHEGNNSLTDLAADRRAATPSEAAEMAVPDVMTEVLKVRNLRAELDIKIRNIFKRKADRLNSGKMILEKNDPAKKLADRLAKLDVLSRNLRTSMDAVYVSKLNMCKVLITELNGLSPTAKLVNGFGYITKDDQPVRSAGDVAVGDKLAVKIHDGDLEVTVNNIKDTARKGDQ